MRSQEIPGKRRAPVVEHSNECAAGQLCRDVMDGGVTAAYWYGDVAEVRAQ